MVRKRFGRRAKVKNNKAFETLIYYKNAFLQKIEIQLI